MMAPRSGPASVATILTRRAIRTARELGQRLPDLLRADVRAAERIVSEPVNRELRVVQRERSRIAPLPRIGVTLDDRADRLSRCICTADFAHRNRHEGCCTGKEVASRIRHVFSISVGRTLVRLPCRALSETDCRCHNLCMAQLYSWGARALFIGPALGLSPHRNAVAVVAVGLEAPFELSWNTHDYRAAVPLCPDPAEHVAALARDSRRDGISVRRRLEQRLRAAAGASPRRAASARISTCGASSF